MAEHLLTTMITAFMLTASPHLEGNIMCRIVSVPEVAFNRAPMTVEIEYSVSHDRNRHLCNWYYLTISTGQGECSRTC